VGEKMKIGSFLVPEMPQAFARLVAVTAGLAIVGLALLILGVPITDPWRFVLLVAAIMAVCFGQVRPWGARWRLALAITFGVIIANWLMPSPQIQEGHNVYIPVGASLEVFQDELPAQAQAIMKGLFDRTYFDNTEGLPGSPGWWQSSAFTEPGHFTDHAFALSSDALWQNPKYSRVVDTIDFRTQDEARIGAINLGQYNFYAARTKPRHQQPLKFKTDSRIDRNAMPHFVMAEINANLVGGQTCWRGDVLWEGTKDEFSLAHSDTSICRPLRDVDIGKRIFALAITRAQPLEFAVVPPVQLRLLLWTKDAIRVFGLLAVLGLLVSFDRFRRLLLPFAAALSTLITTTIICPPFLFGFHAEEGGNDGLVHESFGYHIARAVRDGNWTDALRGGERVYYFMPGLRYFRALEDFLFGDTSYGVVLCTMFIPVFLYFFLRRLLPFRLSVALICLFLLTPLLERFGFAHFLYVKEMIKGFPEPLGYAAFLGGMALVARYVPTSVGPPLPARMPTLLIGLAFALSVAMRPNLAIAAALVLALLALWLFFGKRWRELAGVVFGFSPVLLLALHNWEFGGKFVPLTLTALIPATLQTPPSVYLGALHEVLQRNLVGPDLTQVVHQLGNWNHWSDFYRVVAVFVVLWIAVRRSTTPSMRALAVVALSLQAVLLFYIPSGRYSYLAWLLVFVILVATIREVFLPWVRINYPETWRRLSVLPGVRQTGVLFGSPRTAERLLYPKSGPARG
jgi:hypothetical protein